MEPIPQAFREPFPVQVPTRRGPQKRTARALLPARSNPRLLTRPLARRSPDLHQRIDFMGRLRSLIQQAKR